MRIAVTHQRIDLDAASCIWWLEKTANINEVFFTGKDVVPAEDVEKIRRGREIEEIIFADCHPSDDVLKLEKIKKVSTYDHHQVQSQAEKSSFELLVERRGSTGFDSEKLQRWIALVHHSDLKPADTDMDIQRTLKKRIPLILNGDDHLAYKEWFMPLVNSFFHNPKNIARGQKIFQKAILQFLLTNGSCPARRILEKWSAKLIHLDKISNSSIRNMFHYVSHMDEKMAREWLDLTLRAVDAKQAQFERAKEEFKNSDIDLFGKTLVVSQITSNCDFSEVARYLIKKHIACVKNGKTSIEEKQEIEAVPAKIKETITSKADPWFIIQVHPEKKHFQIFGGGGGDKTQQAILRELVQSIRVEVLKNRRKSIPTNRGKLSQPETLEGTEPLYFHCKDTGFPQILWGSETRPDVGPAFVFGKTSREIKQNLVNIAKMVIDKYYLQRECNPNTCSYCMIDPWQLQKCAVQRKLVRGRMYPPGQV